MRKKYIPKYVKKHVRLEIVLEGMDKIIREEWDKKKYRYKDKLKQTIVTLFGDIIKGHIINML